MISAMGEGKARTVHECALEGDLAALEGLVSSSCSRSWSCSWVVSWSLPRSLSWSWCSDPGAGARQAGAPAADRRLGEGGAALGRLQVSVPLSQELQGAFLTSYPLNLAKSQSLYTGCLF